MDNLEYLKMCKKDETLDPTVYKETGEHEIYFRQAKALEIIAEQIIKLDATLACVITALENIETVIRQR